MARRLSEVRSTAILPYLRPDGKSQVTVEYKDGKPSRLDAIVLGAHHIASVSTEQLRQDLKKLVIDEVVPGQNGRRGS